MIHSKQHRGCRIQGPGTRGYLWEIADFSHSARTARAQRTVRPLSISFESKVTICKWCPRW